MTGNQKNEKNGKKGGSDAIITLGELFPSLVHLRVDEIAAPTPTTEPGTAIALTQRQRYDRILMSDVIDVGASVLATTFVPHRVAIDGNTEGRMRWPTPAEIIEQAAEHKAKCRRQVVNRLIWDEDDAESPYVQAVSWEAKPKDGDFEIVGSAYIPGLGKVRVKPIATVEIPYLTQSGRLWVSNGTDRCVFLRPNKAEHAHTAISLRLCREVLIRNLMAILQAAGNREGMFDALPNKIRTPGAYKTIFTPTTVENPRPPEEGKHNHWEGYKYLGKYWGKVVMLMKGTQQELEVGKSYVFRVVSESENVIVLSFVGLVGGIDVDDKEFKISISAGLDPAMVLELDVKRINRHNILKEVEATWEEVAFEELPGLGYLYESGLLKPDDTEETRLSLVRDERTRAAKKIKKNLDDVFELTMGHFNRLPPLSTLLGDVEYEAMLEADAGEDPVTALIAERIGEFSWEMPMCVEIRKAILAKAKENPEGNLEAPATENSPVEQPAAEPIAAPNTEAPRPPTTLRTKIGGKAGQQWVIVDAYAFLGLTSEKTGAVFAELQAKPEPDLTVAALVINPELEKIGRPTLDPANEKDAATLKKLAAKAKEGVQKNVEKTLASAPAKA